MIKDVQTVAMIIASFSDTTTLYIYSVEFMSLTSLNYVFGPYSSVNVTACYYMLQYYTRI